MASTYGALAGAALFVLACGSSSHSGGGDESARSGGAGVAGSGGSSSLGGSRSVGGSSGRAASGGAAEPSAGGSGAVSGAAVAGTGAEPGTGGNSAGSTGGGSAARAGAPSSGGRAGAGGTNPGGAAGSDENGGTGEPGTVGAGQVQIVSLVNVASGYAETALTAYFEAPSTAPSNCRTNAFGPCTLYTCDAPASAQASSPDAGSISANSDAAGFVQTITPDQTGTYSSYLDESIDFHGGESISVVASGGAVPSFQAQIAFPLPLVLTAPATSAALGMAIRVPADQDLVLTWDRGVAGVTFQLASPATNPISLVCNQPAETGGVTIPASALGSLPTGTALALYTIADERLQLAGYDVAIVAGAGVKAPDLTRTLELVIE